MPLGHDYLIFSAKKISISLFLAKNCAICQETNSWQCRKYMCPIETNKETFRTEKAKNVYDVN